METTLPPKPPSLPKKKIVLPFQPGWTYDEQTGRSQLQFSINMDNGGAGNSRGGVIVTDYNLDSRRL